MNPKEERYTRFSLCQEMLESPALFRHFSPASLDPFVALAQGAESFLFTGEGSSRLFPAKRARAEALRKPQHNIPLTEGATQALEYDLSHRVVLGASNSGHTKELVRLYKTLRKQGHRQLLALTAHQNTPLEEVAHQTLHLRCGAEQATAATKSVLEQALIWQGFCAAMNNESLPNLAEAADALSTALSTAIPPSFAKKMAQARTIYFAGRNDGVAEELALKTNEIVRKPSSYLEGSYAAHGVEEVMNSEDVVIFIDPFASEEKKFQSCLEEALGVTVFSLASRDTVFPTVKIPAEGPWKEYILLAAGWNLLVEAGIEAGVNLDKPVHARKVGNAL